MSEGWGRPSKATLYRPTEPRTPLDGAKQTPSRAHKHPRAAEGAYGERGGLQILSSLPQEHSSAMEVEVALVDGKSFCGYSFTDRIQMPIVASPVVKYDCATDNRTIRYDTNNGACGR